MLRATQRDEARRLKLTVAAVRLGAWGSAEDLARMEAPEGGSGAAQDETDAALAAFGLRREG